MTAEPTGTAPFIPGPASCRVAVIATFQVKPMAPASNVVPLEPAAHPARAPAGQESFERPFIAIAAQAWQLQFELAWSYPRFCYAVWSRLTTLGR